jgi:hypothetical protein
MVRVFDNIEKMLSMQREYIMVTSPDRDENSLQITPPDRVERHQTEFLVLYHNDLPMYSKLFISLCG